jgi:uncharacterized protein YyaL (SSP411 family)
MTPPERRPNRLIHESSPYLRQHAHNPVDWYAWGDEALERARREDRPIFLSIGYSACHWCHVMEHESFENPDIAELMNSLFINIKVDREERPDLDRIYMSAVQMISGAGGWPMSVFLTPQLKPFFGGTYYPPEDRWGRPGFPKLLQAVAGAFRTNREAIESSGEQVAQRIASIAAVGPGDTLLTPALLDAAAQSIVANHDLDHGGFGTAPKFPQSIVLQLLLREYRRSGDLEVAQVARTSLDAMAAGGIYDHLGGGFHRYSTDDRWLVPHFEKMLYDNALLAIVYLEAYQATGDEDYARVARETLDYLLREMTSPEGGFYSTQDADSEGEEGAFFIWTVPQIRGVLTEEDADLCERAYGVDEVGNFEGRSVLYRAKTDAALAASLGLDETAVASRLAACRAALFQHREGREKPSRDEKILADWNGLAIMAFARGSRVLAEPRYRDAAVRAGEFIGSRMRDSQGRLFHVWTHGDAKIPAFLDDHACLLAGMVDLYEATGNPRWLADASSLRDAMVVGFWDEQDGAFFDTAQGQGDLIARTRDASDGAVPSGNSMAAFGLIRLARILGEADPLMKAERVLRAFVPMMQNFPMGASQMLVALDLFLAPSQEVAIVGPEEDGDTRALCGIVDRLFLPHTVLLRGDGASDAGLAGLTGKGLVRGRPAAYVCAGFACKAPVTAPLDLAEALRR